MADQASAGTLTGVIESMESIDGNQKRVSVAAVLMTMGERSFGPFLLLPGLFTASPMGGVPGVPTTSAIVIALVAGQMLIGHKCCWLPDFILRRRIRRSILMKSLSYLEPVAKFADRFIGERLAFLTAGPPRYAIAAACLVMAVAMPLAELVPLSDTPGAVAVVLFGLAMVTRDGVLAILGFLLTAVALAFVVAIWR